MSTEAFDPRAFEDETGLELERYSLAGCERKRRNGDIDFPYEGCHVWLTPDTPVLLTSAMMGLQAAGTTPGAGDRGFTDLCKGLSRCVAGLDIANAPKTWNDPDAVKDLPSELIYYTYKIAMTGEVPEDRPNASTRGRGGSTTPRSTERKTSSTSTARALPENG